MLPHHVIVLPLRVFKVFWSSRVLVLEHTRKCVHIIVQMFTQTRIPCGCSIISINILPFCNNISSSFFANNVAMFSLLTSWSSIYTNNQ